MTIGVKVGIRSALLFAQARRLHLALCSALPSALVLQASLEFSMLMFYVSMISCHLAGELCSHAYNKCFIQPNLGI
jgi:hypothetical protein